MLIKRLPYSISFAICLICLASQVIAIAKPTVQIRYPASVATNDPHNKYVLELLRTALKILIIIIVSYPVLQKCSKADQSMK